MIPIADLRERYLRLVRDSVVGLLDEDPAMAFDRQTVSPAFVRQTRVEGRDFPATAPSMIGATRLLQLQRAAETVIEEGVPGDFLEAGVWRGGACILLRAVLAAWGDAQRRVWAADSFEGMPPPEPERAPRDARSPLHGEARLTVTLEETKRHFARYGLLDEQVGFLEGWFRDTLSDPRIERLAVLRIDAVFHGSTRDALVALHDKVSPGGYVIVDDYGAFVSCRVAVEEFRRERGIDDPIEWIDDSGIFWRRGTGAAAGGRGHA